MFRPCVVIPTFNNPATIRRVVERVRQKIADIVVVDDGGGAEAAAEIDRLGAEQLAHVVRRKVNGGKGAAVKSGFEAARSLGYTHVLQVDADDQHDLNDIPRFLASAEENPDALILGHPIFDATVPRGRLAGRQVSIFWAALETGGRAIVDPMCGFRVYPLAAAMAERCGDGMEFDIEIGVRMAWSRVPVVNLPTRVRYVPAAEGGVSHFRLWRDNARISWLHTRLCVQGLLRFFLWPLRRRGARAEMSP